jgi:hypothetical protein
MVVATANAVWILGHHGDRNRAFARSRIQLPGLPRIATMRAEPSFRSTVTVARISAARTTIEITMTEIMRTFHEMSDSTLVAQDRRA